jgi:hypothetical protein
VGGCCATHSAAGGGKRRTDMRAVVNGLMWRGAYNLLLLATQYVSCLPGSKYKPPQLSLSLQEPSQTCNNEGETSARQIIDPSRASHPN